MKNLVLVGLMALSTNAMAANCFLEPVDSNGHFGPAIIKAENMNQIADESSKQTFSDTSGVYKMEITKLTQTNFGINVYQNGRLILQTRTIAATDRYQWVRSSVMPNADGSGVSAWCWESAR